MTDYKQNSSEITPLFNHSFASTGSTLTLLNALGTVVSSISVTAIGDTTPVGAIQAFAYSSVPSGWLECNGQVVLVSTYQNLANAIYVGSTLNPTALFGYKCTNPASPTTSRSAAGAYIVIPDLRGEFIRGWDNARGIDPGRAFRTWQQDAMLQHNHRIDVNRNLLYSNGGGRLNDAPGTNDSYDGDGAVDRTSGVLQVTGYSEPIISNETRPRNIAMLYCIKAFTGVLNTTMIDVANLAAQITSLQATSWNNTTVPYSATTRNGYIQFPSGIIFEWGHIVGQNMAANRLTDGVLISYTDANGNVSVAGHVYKDIVYSKIKRTLYANFQFSQHANGSASMWTFLMNTNTNWATSNGILRIIMAEPGAFTQYIEGIHWFAVGLAT